MMNGNNHHETTNAFVSLELELVGKNGHPTKKIRAKRKAGVRVPLPLEEECFDASLTDWMNDCEYKLAPKSKFGSPPRIEFSIPQLKRRFSIPDGWIRPINANPYPRFHIIWDEVEVRRVEKEEGELIIRVVLIGTVHLDSAEHHTACGMTALDECTFEAGRVATYSF
ncbi:MAG TPA: hypothetical protein VJB93_03850 [Patescibacteria group bacterium]|nr:hypothetical protein [Patescibacteria group bacterium]